METLAYLSNIPETIKLLAENSDHVCITFFFQLLFGSPMANFGPLLRGQPHSPDVNHCISVLHCHYSLE